MADVEAYRKVVQMPRGHTADANDRTLTTTCLVGYDKAVHDSLGMCPTRVSLAFFSEVNVQYLQKRTQHAFHRLTGIVIEPQRSRDLLTIMRYIYVSRARNVDGYEAEQLSELNEHVLREVLPKIATAVEQHLHYLKDASVLPTPMERGLATTIRGEVSNVPGNALG